MCVLCVCVIEAVVDLVATRSKNFHQLATSIKIWLHGLPQKKAVAKKIGHIFFDRLIHCKWHSASKCTVGSIAEDGLDEAGKCQTFLSASLHEAGGRHRTSVWLP